MKKKIFIHIIIKNSVEYKINQKEKKKKINRTLLIHE